MNVNFNCIPHMMAALLGASTLYALACVVQYGVQKYLHLVNQLSDVTSRLDVLSETTRQDFATQWRRQSTLSEQQNELEIIIKVQAEQLAKQNKQILLIQQQYDNLREKTEETFRAQAAQFNHRFAFQQEMRDEYDRLKTLCETHDTSINEVKSNVDTHKDMINKHTEFLEMVRSYANMGINIPHTMFPEYNRKTSCLALLE
jgi:hypothetical protein